MREFAPGEILTKIWKQKATDKKSAELDFILYLQYIFTSLEVVTRGKLTIGGKYVIGKFFYNGAENIHMDDENGQTKFFARRQEAETSWSILVCKQEQEWQDILEYAFDKVRTTQDASMETWRAEYPAIGLIDD